MLATLPPPTLREIPITTGAFLELTWQHAHGLHRTDSPESLADLTAWQARRPRLRSLDLTDPTTRRRLEVARLAALRRSIERGRGWLAGASVLVSGRGVGWPVGLRSRPQRMSKRIQAEAQWLADVAGLRLLIIGDPGAQSALMALPRVAIPEFTNFAAICRDAGIDPSVYANLT